MFVPKALETAISAMPLRAAMTDEKREGRDAPMAVKVSPMMSCGTPMTHAMRSAAHTIPYAITASHTSTITNVRGKNGSNFSFLTFGMVSVKQTESGRRKNHMSFVMTDPSLGKLSIVSSSSSKSSLSSSALSILERTLEQRSLRLTTHTFASSAFIAFSSNLRCERLTVNTVGSCGDSSICRRCVVDDDGWMMNE